jgi:hypothetical protein
VTRNHDADARGFDRSDEIGNSGDRERIDAGEGFVEQDDRRVCRQRADDLAAPAKDIL